MRGASAREKARMVIAATTFAQAAFCVADDSRLIGGPPRAAAGHGRRDFYSWPGRELGVRFSKFARKIRTYDYRPE
jgi:hypothetical protein